MQLFASSQKKTVSKKKEPSRAAGNESRQQLLITDRKRAQIQVTNMSCASCVATIERELGKKPGSLIICTMLKYIVMLNYVLVQLFVSQCMSWPMHALHVNK